MFSPSVRKIPWRRKLQPTPVFLPGKSHGQRSLVGYSPKSPKEFMTEHACKHTQGPINIILTLAFAVPVQRIMVKGRSVDIITICHFVNYGSHLVTASDSTRLYIK